MQKFVLLFLILPTIVFADSSSNSKNRLSWSLLYGKGALVHLDRKVEGISQKGKSYKFLFGERVKDWEFSLFMRYMYVDDDFTMLNSRGDLIQEDRAVGFHIGYWFFNWLKIHAGFGRHYIFENFKGSIVSSEESQIRSKYKISSRDTYGVLGGIEFVPLQFKSFQFYLNYDYYRLNALRSHQWEAMAGLRFYLEQSKQGSKGNFFTKAIESIFAL